MAKLMVKVTAGYIRRGVPMHKKSCPIALALKAKGMQSVVVDDVEISFRTKEAKEISVTPTKRVEKFINNFDEDDTRHKCKPFTFSVKI